MAVDPLLQRNDGEPPAAGQLRSCERSRISPTGGVVLGEASQLGEFTRQPSGTAATSGGISVILEPLPITGGMKVSGLCDSARRGNRGTGVICHGRRLGGSSAW
jgi:hypothetical protein